MADPLETAIAKSVGDRLAHNVVAYGKAWNGDADDTEFLCMGTGKVARDQIARQIEEMASQEERLAAQLESVQQAGAAQLATSRADGMRRAAQRVRSGKAGESDD
jgi:hypothetical protein